MSCACAVERRENCVSVIGVGLLFCLSKNFRTREAVLPVYVHRTLLASRRLRSSKLSSEKARWTDAADSDPWTLEKKKFEVIAVTSCVRGPRASPTLPHSWLYSLVIVSLDALDKFRMNLELSFFFFFYILHVIDKTCTNNGSFFFPTMILIFGYLRYSWTRSIIRILNSSLHEKIMIIF